MDLSGPGPKAIDFIVPEEPASFEVSAVDTGCVIQGKVERIGEPTVPRRPVRAPAPPAVPRRGGKPA